jgi:uncharacterized repeat protein (TIGR03803 family)
MRSRKNSVGVVVSAILASTLFLVGAEALAQTETVLHSFASGPKDGYSASGLIMDSAGNLYGTTRYGDEKEVNGIAFELSPSAGGTWTETALHIFTGGTDGLEPVASLVLDAKGNLYGTTLQGGGGPCKNSQNGPLIGCGTVFELSPGAGGVWTEKILYAFGFKADDSFWPYSNLVLDAAGNLYGTTSLGGTVDGEDYCVMYGNTSVGCGTAFELRPNKNGTWSEEIIHNFGGAIDGGADGAIPDAGLVFDSAGNLYGTTRLGGMEGCGGFGRLPYCGVLFELTPVASKGWREGILPSPGFWYQTGLAVDSAGNVFGSGWDGFGSCGYDYGVGTGGAFEISPAGGGTWTESGIGDFGCGSTPSPLIFDSKGNVYGTTDATNNDGGENYPDTIYEASRGSSGDWQVTILYQFTAATDGLGPTGGLVRDAAGNLYGTTQGGGTHNKGVVFKLTP